MNDRLGNRILELRTSQQITQGELANRVGVTRQAISKWERGEGLPDLYNTQQLARALNVSVDELIGEEPQRTYTSNRSTEPINLQNVGGYFKRLMYKARHTTNSEEALKLRKKLLIIGGIGLAVGLIMVVSGFFGFANGAFNSVNNFSPDFGFDDNGFPTIEEPQIFNPIPYMALFMLGGVISGISIYVLYIGLAVVVAGVTTKFLDTRKPCPKCGDKIDADEKSCSNCGYNLEANMDYRCECGKENEPNDKFCRECGKKITT